jgi:hypothetical protein
MKVGDKVGVLTIPPDLPESDIQTKLLFEKCAGRIFPIVGFQEHLLELHVGQVRGEAPNMQSIWIEPENVEIVTTAE